MNGNEDPTEVPSTSLSDQGEFNRSLSGAEMNGNEDHSGTFDAAQ
jgi:hypothetical protein